ncbi:hypothetical protein CJJ07_000888 [Candidozyma auris]|nr:hypothetical protein CJJ07_000888 [[Candida] auris]QEL58737.1 hypothetical protein CJJ09_000787 [[Candida] auris]
MFDQARGRPLVRASSTTTVHQLNKTVGKSPQRSHSTQLPHKPHGSGELLQKAIRNDQIKHSSTKILDASRSMAPPSKNIPMVIDNGPPRALNPPSHSHRTNKRWDNFRIDYNPAESSGKVHQPQILKKPNVSPLTQIKQPSFHSQDISTDRGSEETSVVETPRIRSNASSLRSKSSFQSSRPTKTHSHASMNTLVPMPRYESESDTSGEEDEISSLEHIDSDRALATGDAEEVNASSNSPTIFQIVQDIQDFQNLVTCTSQRRSIPAANRTQQRMLDLKQHQEEQEASVVTQSLDHAVKIQNEALLTAWTSIRLRFSNHIDEDSKSTLSCTAGVLGSIQRRPLRSQKNAEPNLVRRGDKDEYLKEMWNTEFHEMFDGHLEPNTIIDYDEEDIYSGDRRKLNMSHMASRAHISREQSEG